MIYEWGRRMLKVLYSIRHFFRAFGCKHYYVNPRGIGKCDMGKFRCDWHRCPKRREDGEE